MSYFSKIKGVKETDKGTDLIVHIPDEFLQDKILRQQAYNAEVRINDGRTITVEQRKKIYATIKDISLYTGDDPEYLKEFLKYDYCAESGEVYFSLSDCSIDIAKELITHIIDFVLKENIPLSDVGLNRTEDIDKYLYGCIKYKRCSICGISPSDLHHVQAIGMGVDRRIYDDSKHEKIQLCRKHHQMAHQIGWKEFSEKFKVYGIIYKEG